MKRVNHKEVMSNLEIAGAEVAKGSLTARGLKRTLMLMNKKYKLYCCLRWIQDSY